MLKLFTFHYGQIYYNFSPNNVISSSVIYIPLWLDLLLFTNENKIEEIANLHSTMVRFIITTVSVSTSITSPFTFHYGQIYYAGIRDDEFLKAHIYIPLWLDLLFLIFKSHSRFQYYLHSTMVRFIIFLPTAQARLSFSFTFHYGQIYYFSRCWRPVVFVKIYIPLWLDLLCGRILLRQFPFSLFTFHYGQIYYAHGICKR